MTRLPRRPRALLLDFDGVILDSAKLKTRAFADIYAGTDPARLAKIHDYVERHGGVTRAAKLAHIERAFFGRPGGEVEVARLAEAFRVRVYEAVVAAGFVPGAEDFLARAHPHVAMHLVSGTPHDELVEIVERRGLARWFATVHGAPPDKRSTFERLLREGAYPPAEVLAVGDALTEYEAARELGVPFLAIVPAGAADRFPADVPKVETLEPAADLLGLPPAAAKRVRTKRPPS